MFRKLLNKLSQSNKQIKIDHHLSAISKLHDIALFDISNMLNRSESKKNDVILISIERGGNIPATLLNYSLSDSLREDVASGLLNIHSVHVNLSTRDRKPGSNKEALNALKKEIERIIAKNPGCITEGSLAIYFVEDLLDSGKTLSLLDRAFRKEIWFGGGISTLLVCYAKQTLDFYLTEGLPLRLKAGEILNTKKWLSFWYDGTSY